jgi:putative YhdH/YhfP family quinone oxidoreductase
MSKNFKALVVRKEADRHFNYAVEDSLVSNLPANEVLIRVLYSSINYKDLMSCQGNPAITRRFPHTPGIDAAGIVERTNSSLFTVGEKVIVYSQQMGMTQPGGFGQYVCVPESWVMRLPPNLSLEESMAWGTAGFTAALAVQTLLNNGIESQKDNKILVTGSTGGVGCFSVALLAYLGFNVVAETRKLNATQFLSAIGAKEVLSQESIEAEHLPNLLKPQWDATIDVVGGSVLSSILKKMANNGVVIATGLAQSTHFSTTVLPFILRGVKLIGVNVDLITVEQKKSIWEKMASLWKPKSFSSLYQTIPLSDLPLYIEQAHKGELFGRIVIDLG